MNVRKQRYLLFFVIPLRDYYLIYLFICFFFCYWYNKGGAGNYGSEFGFNRFDKCRIDPYRLDSGSRVHATQTLVPYLPHKLSYGVTLGGIQKPIDHYKLHKYMTSTIERHRGQKFPHWEQFFNYKMTNENWASINRDLPVTSRDIHPRTLQKSYKNDNINERILLSNLVMT